MTGLAADAVDRYNMYTRMMGVTGTMGSGKTYVCQALMKQAADIGLEACHIDVDAFRRRVFGNDPDYFAERSGLAARLGIPLDGDNSLDRAALNSRIYSDPQAMATYKQTLYPALGRHVQEQSHMHKGLVLVEWALLAEDQLLDMVQCQVLLVTCDPQVQLSRLIGGDLPAEEVKRRLGMQKSSAEKYQLIDDWFCMIGHGYLAKKNRRLPTQSSWRGYWKENDQDTRTEK